VLLCAKCGRESEEGFAFCPHCGAELKPAASREQRKTVTVLFCDVAGYTEAGERLDAEALRKLQSRYFDEARAALERHGGTVEKFIGDAVMAVFGIPQVHEDDALRAVRAAVELRDAISDLGLRARIGINTGEVVVGSGDALVTGDAVNVAARLEQAAEPGGILIGDATHRLVSDAATSEGVGPLEAKGKAEALGAWRLLGVSADAEAVQRRLDSPMVGRERERTLLRQAFDRAAEERACHLFTVLGVAGVGKSRLIAELCQDLEKDATVATGRCLPYGDGITFWPLHELLNEFDARRAAALRRLLEAELSAPEELFFQIRKEFEALARERPLVVIFDDVHWAEATFLDFVDHVSDWSRDAPILLVCLARPELLDERPAWGGGKLNATSVLLEPLPDAECELLIANFLGEGELAAETRARILEAAEGNPLFVEEMLEMLIDDGLLERRNGSWVAAADLTRISVPPTIHALLHARLDRLSESERAVAERAAVEGKLFHRGAVVALAPEPLKTEVSAHLLALVRKELVRPDEAEFHGEDAFRFRHLLLRDAAYESLPKETRADLHERFSNWMEAKVGDLSQYEEIIGYHLEQASRYRQELGPGDESLGRRAAERLASAGRRAKTRSDTPAAVGLFARAIELLPAADPERAELVIDLADAAFDAGDYRRSGEAAEELIRIGGAQGDAQLEWRGRVQALAIRMFTDPNVTMDEAKATAEAALPVLEQAGDEAGLARAFRLLGYVHHGNSREEEHLNALEQALEHARNAGDTAHEAEIMGWLGVAHVFGPTPVDQAEAQLEQILDEARAKSLLSVEGIVLRFLGGLEAMRGRFDEARELFERGRAILADIGLRSWLAGQTHLTGYAEFLAGDYEAAEREFRFGYDEYERMGETGIRSTSAAMLAEALYEQGRDDEAERYVDICRETAAAGDNTSQVGWRVTAARLLARRGDLRESERLAQEAVALVAPVEGMAAVSDPRAWSALGETLALAGKREEAARAFQRAIRLYERKGNHPGMGRTSELRARLRLESE